MNRESEPGSLRNLNSVCASTAFGLFAALSASDLSPSVNAQTPPATGSTTNAPAALPEVVVTGEQTPGYKPAAISSPKIVTPPRDTPQTINVVPRKVIDDQNATTLRDVLRNVPGISFQAGEGGVPAGDQLTIRGFPARTDLFIDGFRDAGGYTRDSFNLEQVEVFKGPNSAYSGRGSTGGSVNTVTRTPKLNSFYDATLGYGSAEYYRGTIDVNQPLPELEKIGLKGAAFRLNGLYQDQDFAGRDYVHDNRWALNPTFTVGLGTNTRATLSYLHLQEDNLPSYGLPFVNTSNNPFGGVAALGKVAPVSYHRFFGLVNRDYEDIYNDVANLRFEHDFSEDLKLQNQTRYGRTYRDSVITAPRIVAITALNVNDPIFGPNTVAAGNAAPGSSSGQFGLNHELQSRDQTTQLLGNQTDLRLNFETGKLEHQSTLSLEVIHEEEINYLRSGLVPGFPLSAQTSDPRNPNPFDPHHPVRRTGAYNQIFGDGAGISAFDMIKVHEKFLLSGGLRGDVFAADYRQISTNGVQFLNPTRTDLAATWRAGAVYKPLPNGSIFFGYGTSFNPSAEGLTLTTNLAAIGPETGVNFELGSKWDLLDERLSVTGALFRTDKDNYRNADPANGGIISNSGKVRVQGIELGVSGKITDHWNVSLSYTLMESDILRSKATQQYNGQTYKEQGHRLSNTPDQTASVSTTYELPHRITLGTGVFFVDERFSNNIGTQSAPGYWLQDASIAWSVNEHLYLRLNVLNLWDKEYIDRVGGGHAIPGAGRTVILTAGIHF